jgi:hypothetical protein
MGFLLFSLYLSGDSLPNFSADVHRKGKNGENPLKFKKNFLKKP